MTRKPRMAQRIAVPATGAGLTQGPLASKRIGLYAHLPLNTEALV